MDADELLLHKLEDLERHIESPERVEYELISASAILRLILLDGLMTKANRGVRARVRFEVAEFDPFDRHVREINAIAPGLTVDARWMELDPASAPAHWVRRELRLDSFLSYKVLYVHGDFFSVKDVIVHAANSAGGVHFGDANEEHAGLVYANKLLVLDDVPTSITFVRSVAYSTLRALSPLRGQLRLGEGAGGIAGS